MTRNRFLLTGVFLYLVLASALSYTKRPWADEAWFANVSWSMLHHGNTGISVLDPRGNANMMGREFPQIDKHYYIWLPVQQAVYAIWYKIVGFHLLSMRAFSVLWGLAALLAWFIIVGRLTLNPRAATLAVFLIGTDFAFLDASSDGRMDIMVAALSAGALAAYLLLRERSLNAAVVVSQALAMTAGLAHPMGAIGFISLLFITLSLDGRKSIRLRHVGLAVAVYLVGIAVAAAYFLPGLDLLRAQLGAALTGRLGAANSLWSTLLREVTVKFRLFYLPPYASGLAYSRVLIPVIYALGVAGLVSLRSVRSQPGYRTFFRLMLLAFLAIGALDSGKLYYYLVYSTPFLAAALALWVTGSVGRWRYAAVTAAAIVVALQLGWVATVVRRDPYHQSFLPMAQVIKSKIKPSSIVTSSAELGFAIGFEPPLVDDALLGFASHKNPTLFVYEERSYGSHYSGFEKYRPEVAAHINHLRDVEFRQIYTDGYYRVYERK